MTARYRDFCGDRQIDMYVFSLRVSLTRVLIMLTLTDTVLGNDIERVLNSKDS